MKAAGGVAPFNITDGRTGEVKAVEWYAPALNTVFYRFDEDGGAVHHRLRPSVLADVAVGHRGWRSVERPAGRHAARLHREHPDRARGVRRGRATHCCAIPGHLPAEIQGDIDELANRAVEDGEYASYGEALFNLNLSSGAYSCARCHTPGWSWGDPGVPGQGALGWNLTDGAVDTHFPAVDDMIDFIKCGTELGAKYGTQGQGTGRMPGFGQMLTDEQIEAIVGYVRSL